MPASSWTLPALPGQVVIARRLIGAYAEAHDASAAALANIHLAISEAVTNVVLHAYRSQDAPGDIHLAIEAREGIVEIRVGDDGLGPTPRSDSPGLGLGLGILKQICKRVDIRQRESGGTELLLTMALR